jgi:hypothetical protein
MLGTACCLIGASVMAVAGHLCVPACARPEVSPQLQGRSDRGEMGQGLIRVQAATPSETTLRGRSFSVTVLSRGGGVPDGTFEALKQVRDLLAAYQTSGAALQLTETRIGLEGERRLCAAFADENLANTAWERIRQILANVDLVEMKEGDCAA